MEAQISLKIGDVVRLNGDTVTLTITDIIGENFECTYFWQGLFKTNVFRPGTLTKVNLDCAVPPLLNPFEIQ